MFKIQLLLAWRNILKRRFYSVIEVIGLATGLTCFLVISLHVNNEFSYEKGFVDSEKIYRILNVEEGTGNRYSGFASAIGYHAAREIPEIDAVVRIYYPYKMFSTSALVRSGNQQFYEDNIIEVDSNFFDVFNHHFIEGTSASALTEPTNVIINRRTAEKLFGSEPAVGKLITIDNNETLTISAVIEPPGKTHLDVDYIRPAHRRPAQLYQWDQTLCFTYLKLNSGNIEKAEKQTYDIVLQHATAQNAEYLKNYRHQFEPLEEIHTTPIQWDIVSNTSPVQLLALLGIAFFILVLAIVNFVNLTTARSSERMKESGISKILGASRFRLTLQFFMESLVMCAAAGALALIILALVLPYLNQVVNINIGIREYLQPPLLGALTLLVLTVALLSGLYPAFQISSVKPREVIKRVSTSGSSMLFRNVLVVFQFVISISLLSSTMVIEKQINHMQHTDMGFDKENIFIMRLRREDRGRFHQLKEVLRQKPSVTKIAGASGLIGGEPGSDTFHPDHMQEPTPETFAKNIAVDPGYLDLIGVPLVDGRNFNADNPSDYRHAFIINETAVKQYQLKDPVGSNFRRSGHSQGKVIGVMKDYRFAKMTERMNAMVFFLDSLASYGYMLVKIQGNIHEGVEQVTAGWSTVFPDKPMEGFFQDQYINGLYQQEKQVGILTRIFTVLAVILASLGLLGMSSFNVLRRTREIGIRKVIGASVVDIITMLSSTYFKLISIAFCISIPLTILLMNKWLESFVSRVNIGLTIFVSTAIITLIVALGTMSFQTIKAAIANPVKSLRHE